MGGRNVTPPETAAYSPELMRLPEKSILLQILDQQRKERLLQLDHLRTYGQKDPLIEYKREAFDMFQIMLAGLKEVTVGALAHLEIELDADPESLLPRGDSQAWEQSGPGVGDDLAPFGLPPLGSLEDMAHMSGMDLDVLEPEPEFTNGNGGAMSPVRTGKTAATVDPGDLGQGLAQRALPLQIRQEIQALPRPGLTPAGPHRGGGSVGCTFFGFVPRRG